MNLYEFLTTILASEFCLSSSWIADPHSSTLYFSSNKENHVQLWYW